MMGIIKAPNERQLLTFEYSINLFTAQIFHSSEAKGIAVQPP